MFQTRRRLILIAGILLLINCVATIIVGLLMYNLYGSAEFMDTLQPSEYYLIDLMQTISLCVVCIFGVISLLGGIFLTIVGTSENENKLRSRKVLYIFGIIFAIINGPISIPAILIYIALGMKAVPEEFTPEGKMICQNGNISTQENNVQSTSSCDANSNSNLGDFEQKVKALRKLKDDGLISDEEFKSMFSKLL